MIRGTQPPGGQPVVGDMELAPTAIETYGNVGRGGHGRVVEGALAIAIEPNFCRYV